MKKFHVSIATIKLFCILFVQKYNDKTRCSGVVAIVFLLDNMALICHIELMRSPNYKGGKIIHNGYFMLYKPSHPLAGTNGYVKEHRIIMEEYLGRLLQRNEVVHHINHIKTDNRIENLMLISSSAEHTTFHQTGKKLSEEHKKKLSESNKGKHNDWIGRKHTMITKEKMSEARKRYWKERKSNQ